MGRNHKPEGEEWFWHPKPSYNFIKIVNPSANESMLNDPRYEELGPTFGSDVSCIQKSCDRFPQTVCRECLGYVCEEHIYRHPDCKMGR